MKLSILTPTYNRAKLLKKLYESIKQNLIPSMEVEWLIMDDGSTDETEQYVNGFIEEKAFIVRYFKQENQGKMVALNELVKKAEGERIIECDSDDYFKKGAFQVIENTASTMDEDIYACAYLKYDQNECNMGHLFAKKRTTMFELYFKEAEDGEKALVFNSNIRKQYCYELENKERFITEARMYHKMDKDYQIKCINEPILICEYQEEGYSKNIQEIFKKNPYGYYEYFKEMFEMNLKGISFSKRLYIIKHYILFSVLTNQKWEKSYREVKGKLNKLLFILLYFPGKFLTKKKFN